MHLSLPLVCFAADSNYEVTMNVPPPPLKEVSRVIALFGKKVLLVEKESMPGLFELAGGQRKRREGKKAAALRELKEETGLTVVPKALKRWGHGTLTTTHDSGVRVAVTVYVLVLDAKTAKEVRPRHEITRCRWLTLPKLLSDPRIERKTGLILRLYHVFS